MIRVKLPFGGVTPEQLEAFADVVETLRAAAQGAHHDAPEHPDAPHPAARRGEADPRDLGEPGSPAARAAATRCATSPATRGPASAKDELFDLDPLRRRLRALLRAPPDDAGDAAQGQDRVHARPTSDVAITGIHDVAFPPASCATAAGARRRDARRRRHLDHAAHRADALRLRRARQRRVPEGHRGRAADLRPPGRGCAPTAPARASRCSSTRSASTRSASHGRGGAAGRLGRRARLLRRAAASSIDDERERAPAPPQSAWQPQRRPREFERFRATNVRAQRQDGFVTVEVEDPARRPDARAVPRPRRRSCATTPAATRARPCSRTSSCAGSARSRVYDVWQALERARPRRRRAARDHRRRPLPRHRLAASSGSRARWGSTQARPGAHRVDGDRRRADAPDPHQDERLPERLRPAPHRQHRLLRRVDQGRRAHDPGLHPARRRHLRRRRGRVRHAPEAAPARQARARRGRALDRATTSPSASGRRGVQRVRRARRHRASSRSSSRISRCRSSSGWRR